MKIRELIEVLQEYNQEAVVSILIALVSGVVDERTEFHLVGDGEPPYCESVSICVD